ncbi:MAG: bestrophin family protein [Blastopirellula sp. JB062]
MPRLFPTLHIARPLAIGMSVAGGYVVLVAILTSLTDMPRWQEGDEGAALVAFALGILMVFRTNAAYDRWWEGRKLWGRLVNEIRNLALKTPAYVAVQPEELRQFERLLIAFPHALRLYLRGGDQIRQVPGFERDAAQFSHPPAYIAGLIHQTLGRWNRQGRLVDTIWILDQHAKSLMDISGACERIRKTPLASSYRALVRWCILLYVLTAPWAISFDSGLLHFPLLMLAFVFLIGMELAAEVIEEPFGQDGDDLPLDAICQSIESFVKQYPNRNDAT